MVPVGSVRPKRTGRGPRDSGIRPAARNQGAPAMSTKRVLIAYGTKHGATAGIAEQIGRTLREDGLDAVVLPADDVHDVRAYDAVVLGGSLYAVTGAARPGTARSATPTPCGTARCGCSAVARSTAPPRRRTSPRSPPWPGRCSWSERANT
ncbi:flavodoxin domain-containing protein [Streptomyces yangpuensis]|uniref:flavodoxin domain-containing protein n=1 Tax=Streptomyces yangpuensis TaxID=1648182 RepID=UPI00364C61EC